MRLPDLPKSLLKGLVGVYAYLISPLIGANCRFYPTCSAYAMEALDRHGAIKGSVMAASRLLKCHPWHKGSMSDPVPASIDWGALIGYKSRTHGDDENCGCGRHTKKD